MIKNKESILKFVKLFLSSRFDFDDEALIKIAKEQNVFSVAKKYPDEKIMVCKKYIDKKWCLDNIVIDTMDVLLQHLYMCYKELGKECVACGEYRASIDFPVSVEGRYEYYCIDCIYDNMLKQ